MVPFRIIRKTPKRIYYVRREGRPGDVLTGYVDRLVLERYGEVWNRGTRRSEVDRHLFASRELAEVYLHGSRKPAPVPADLRTLRREMANAHPDRGGTNEEFMAARERYERALRRPS